MALPQGLVLGILGLVREEPHVNQDEMPAPYLVRVNVTRSQPKGLTAVHMGQLAP